MNLPSIADVVADIARVLDETGIDPADLTVAKYSKYGGKYDGRMLRRLGGFQAIFDEAFHQDKGMDINTSRYLQRRRLYINKLERQLADWDYYQKSLFESFRRMFEDIGPIQVTDPKRIHKPKVKAVKRNNIAMISDTHFGLKIDPEEVMTNGYNWMVAARRTAAFVEQVAEFKLDHRDECPILHLCLGGDLGQGIIHQGDAGTDLLTSQVVGASSYLIQAIDHLRQYYNIIHVHCTPDNHLRMIHKGPERAFTQKWDSYATFIHFAVQLAFRGCDDVKFHVPKQAITTFGVLGHKFGLTHGDTHIAVGNIGSSINIKSIDTAVMRLNAAATDGKPYDALMVGHVHVPMTIAMMSSNTQLVVNGTASGTDGFAEAQSFFRTVPYQVLFEATEDYAVGDFRKVDLRRADTDDGLDDIIAPYNYAIQTDKIPGI